MCGIAGFTGSGSQEQLRLRTARMTAALARRGPDADGIHAWPGTVLGHRRLAILDLSDAGRQPMLSDDGQTGVVFNGCIYNFLELRSILEARGHRFRSQCDTEVLVRGYEEWGIDALVARLRGMFAFGLWDNRSRKLFLVRDRLGVKPLVYAVGPHGIGFASTVPALQAAGLGGNIDPAAVFDFLEYDWVSEERCIVQGVRKVQAATIVEWHDGTLSERRYWTLPEPGSRNISFAQAVDEAEALLVESVRLRLISDVPTGALLSGGVDSALICWATRKAGADITAYTVGTPGDSSDETAAAAATARAIGIPHEVIELRADAEPDLNDLIAAYGEPFACTSALGLLRVCRAVKPKATVLLTGDGGDDIFLGYPAHNTFRLAERVAGLLPSPVAATWNRIKLRPGRLPGWLRRGARLMDYSAGGLGAVLDAHEGMGWLAEEGVIGERLAPHISELEKLRTRLPESGRRLLHDFVQFHNSKRFLAEFMTKVDGGAMFWAIEARSPLLDQHLWEFAASLPYDVRLHRGELKAILRELVRRHIGVEVATRKKQGFTVPAERWLKSSWRGHLMAAAEDSVLEAQGWVQKGGMRKVADYALSASRVPRQAWSLIVLEQWYRMHVETVVETPAGSYPRV